MNQDEFPYQYRHVSFIYLHIHFQMDLWLYLQSINTFISKRIYVCIFFLSPRPYLNGLCLCLCALLFNEHIHMETFEPWCISVCIVYIYVSKYVCMNMHEYICMYVCMCLCICIPGVHRNTRSICNVSWCVAPHRSMYMYLCVCIYIYVYIYI